LSPENQNTQVGSPASSIAKLFAGYKGGEDMPLAGYATLLGIYNTAFATLLLTAKNSGRRLPERVSYADLVLLGLATHKISRIIAKDRVTSPLRAPFTEYEEPAGENEVKEKVRGQGLQRAIGDLGDMPLVLGRMGRRRSDFRIGFSSARNAHRWNCICGGSSLGFPELRAGSRKGKNEVTGKRQTHDAPRISR
jgi:hypothetical protein